MTFVDGGHVNRELQRLAREHHGRDTQALQVLYAIEGFLRRLSVSDYRERMVLKGGMLLAVLDARRMTRDADLSAHGIANDESSVAEIVAEIASTTLSEHDGVVFDTTGVSTESMRESATYRGMRSKLPASIGVARIVVALDLSFGDPGEVEEIRYPEILGGAGIPLLAYPLERTLAEKIATMMERGELNTRDRDFADVWVLSRLHAIDGERLRAMLVAVAEQRRHLSSRSRRRSPISRIASRATTRSAHEPRSRCRRRTGGRIWSPTSSRSSIRSSSLRAHRP